MGHMNVTLRQLRAFIAVASSGSFTRASEQLHIAQSAVSVLIQELEAELRTRLFDRTTRRVELTEPGKEFRPHVEKLLADLAHAVHDAHDLAARKRGRITIAAPPTLATALIPKAISTFTRDFPGVKVILLDTHTSQIAAKVKSGEADIGVGTFPDWGEDFARTVLARDVLAVFCDPQHPLAAKRRPKWRDLKGLPLITLTRASGIRDVVEFGYRSAGLPIQPFFEVSQISTAMALVETGLGVTVLPTLARAYSSARRIAIRPISHPNVPQEIASITNRHRALPPAAEDFMASLRKHARILEQLMFRDMV